MKKRSVPVLLPIFLAAGLFGGWAGSSLAQLPPIPTVSVPTVTVPTAPLPPPPPVPPVPPVSVTTPTVPSPPPPPSPNPPPPPPAVPSPQPATAPAATTSRGEEPRSSRREPGAADRGSRAATRGRTAGRVGTSRGAAVRTSRRGATAPRSLRARDAGRAGGGSPTDVVGGATAKRRPYEDEPVGGPLGATVDTLEEAAEAVPPPVLALAALAVLLLGVAAMQPAWASRTGAALVHHRGTIALAGLGVLFAAVLSFALL
jgi:hypothetical protein